MLKLIESSDTRSSGETLWCPPEALEQALPHVIGMLNDAVEQCGDWTLKDICSALQEGRAFLWVIWDGQNISAAAVSQFIGAPKGKICQVIACGGTAISWPESIAPIEHYAKAENCVSMRIWGRPGWARVFKDYRLEWLSLEKKMD